MKNVSDIILAIRLRHGEVTLSPSDLLLLVKEIDRMENELDQAAMDAAGESS